MEQKVVQKAPEQAKKTKPNMTGIPTQMKLDFERRSGLSFDDVRVHYNSDKPAKIDALAYAQGSEVFIGPGHHQHLQHELIHVIQQKTGRVTPGFYFDNKIINDSKDLEAEASHNVINRGTISQKLTTNIIQRVKSLPRKTKAKKLQAMAKKPVPVKTVRSGKNAGTRSNRLLKAGKVSGRPNFAKYVRKWFPSERGSTSIDHIVSYHQIQILAKECVKQYSTTVPILENLFLRLVHLVAPKPSNPLTRKLYDEGVSSAQKKKEFWDTVEEKYEAAKQAASAIHHILSNVRAPGNISTSTQTSDLDQQLSELVITLNQSLVNLRLGGNRINSSISHLLDPIYKSEIMCILKGHTCVVYSNKSLESQFMAQRLHRLFSTAFKISTSPQILGPHVGTSVASSDLLNSASSTPHTKPSTPYTKRLDFGMATDYYLIVIHESRKYRYTVVHIAFFTSKGDLELYQTVKGNVQSGAGDTLQLVPQGVITTKRQPKPSSAAQEVTLGDLNCLITSLYKDKNYSTNSSASTPHQADISYPLF